MSGVLLRQLQRTYFILGCYGKEDGLLVHRGSGRERPLVAFRASSSVTPCGRVCAQTRCRGQRGKVPLKMCVLRDKEDLACAVEDLLAVRVLVPLGILKHNLAADLAVRHAVPSDFFRVQGVGVGVGVGACGPPIDAPAE
jgi:hypothetical protein